jgi:hypothetical protein
MIKIDSRTLIWTIVLGIIPIISFILIYNFAVQSDTLGQLKTNYAIYYLDWLFLPFNILFAYAFKFSKKLFAALLIASLVVIGILNFTYWTFERNIGYVHGIFAAIELALLITALLSSHKIKNIAVISFIPILLYFIIGTTVLFFVYRHKTLFMCEGILFMIGAIVIALKMIFIAKEKN